LEWRSFPLGREHLLPQLPGLRYHLQLLLFASVLLLLKLPGGAQDGGFADAPGSMDPTACVLLLHLSPKLYLARESYKEEEEGSRR